MAYFDSSKNRALWKRELAGLMEEKERRLREGYEPASQKVSKKSDYANNPF